MSVSTKREGNMTLAVLTMLIGPLLLFWLPGIGSFLAGLLGGHFAGSAGRGVLAAVLPAIAVVAVLFVLSLLGGPIGAIVGGIGAVVFFVLLVVHGIAVILGAAIGGALL